MNDEIGSKSVNDVWNSRLDESYSSFQVKIFQPKGEFGWHVHEHEDELFIAIHGEFTLKLKDQDVFMKEGDSYLVPKGVEHTTTSKQLAQAVVVRSFEKFSIK